MRASLAAGLLSCAAVLCGCQETDIGKPCSLDGDTNSASDGEGRSESEEIVAYDVTFPCDELICIATAGHSGYCSKRCRENAACPAGFECRVIEPVGTFAGEKYCAWKQCQQPSDCGSKDDFCCRSVIGSDPLGQRKYCDFKTGGKCE